MGKKIYPYHPDLKQKARDLRNNSTLSEVILWKQLKGKDFGVMIFIDKSQY